MTAIDGALVVVTGAGSGIGRATVDLLGQRGARVAAVDLDQEAAAAAAAAAGGTAHQADVADAGAMTRLAETLGGIPDVLVNNAGVGLTGRFLDTTAADWEWILGVNLWGVVHGCRAFVPAMLARGSGHVVNVSSGLAYTPRATEPAYVTTKAAVLALSQCLRADWAPRGVGVSVVCPGVIDTPIAARTRYRGDRVAAIGRVRRLFSHGHPPALVARAVVTAIERDRLMVPVGLEARVGWLLHRVLPLRAVEALAGAGGI
ncbi:MAG: SDR family NAD(P)-dependent oxidoreductase [Acidimicrobiales bacterium]